MQEKSFTELFNVAMEHPFETRKIKAIAETNKAALPAILPKGVHIPDEDELEQIALWMASYKQQFPNASKRQIRKATQEHFSVRIFRKPNKASNAIQS